MGVVAMCVVNVLPVACAAFGSKISLAISGCMARRRLGKRFGISCSWCVSSVLVRYLQQTGHSVRSVVVRIPQAQIEARGTGSIYLTHTAHRHARCTPKSRTGLDRFALAQARCTRSIYLTHTEHRQARCTPYHVPFFRPFKARRAWKEGTKGY